MKEIVDGKIKRKSFGERVDDAIGFFSPMTAVKRKAARMAYDIQKKQRRGAFSSYRGASKDRLRSAWIPGSGSADQDLLPELPDLRDRSRDLVRNDATAAGIIGTVNTNVVGSGIKPQSRIVAEDLGVSEEEAIRLQRECEKIWKEWVPFADAGERLDFYEIQSLVDRQILENGEIFLVPVVKKGGNRPLSLAYQLVEADRVSTPSDKTQDKTIRSGIRIGDTYGEPVSYFIKKAHPGNVTIGKSAYRNNTSDSYQEIEAVNPATGRKNVYHFYMPLRPDQTRGIPFFSPVLTYFKDLADYLEAELVTARIAACFSIFVKKEQAYEAALGNTDSTNAKAQRIQEFEPGLIEYLNPGESIESFSPQRPGGSFEPFVNRILRSISTALGLPYELVAKDFSQTNYSSARAALIEAMKYFRTRQAWLERKLCQPTWELVIEEAYLKGKINATNFYKDPASYTRAIWISPGSQWIDPLKEVKASKEAMDGNITSLADVCASQGKDWEEVMEQKAREARKKKELEDKYGVTIGANDSVVDPAEIEPEEDPDETDEKERQEAAGEK
jgi:lambda family phage portal protein